MSLVESLKRIEVLVKGLDSRVRTLERNAYRRRTDPRDDESFEDWKDRLLEMVREEKRFSGQPCEDVPDFKVTRENLDESLKVLEEVLEELRDE